MVFCPFEGVHLSTCCVQISNSFLPGKAVNQQVNSSVQCSSAINSVNIPYFSVILTKLHDSALYFIPVF